MADPLPADTSEPAFVPPPSAKVLRQKFLAAKVAFRQERLTIDLDGEQVVIVVREPTKAERSFMFKEGGMTEAGQDADGNARMVIKDGAKLEVFSVIYCCRTETGERIFEVSDAAELLALPSRAPWFAQAAAVIGRMMGDANEAGKP